MPRYIAHICNPGFPYELSEKQRAEMCRCTHERRWHWFGGGTCGECDGCDSFIPKQANADD